MRNAPRPAGAGVQGRRERPPRDRAGAHSQADTDGVDQTTEQDGADRVRDEECGDDYQYSVADSPSSALMCGAFTDSAWRSM